MPLAKRDWSGRYEFNGGVDLNAIAVARGNTAVANPLHDLTEPVFLDEPPIANRAAHQPGQPSMTLAIDIDGPEPRGVVSGTIVADASAPTEPPVHFISQVTTTESVQGKTLKGGGLGFRWPGGSDMVDRFEIELRKAGLPQPTATITFLDAPGIHRHGPFEAQRVSSYFRTVEVDIDLETGATDIEKLNTHGHPVRPANVEAEVLTLESVFERAGIEVVRSENSGNVIDASAAGIDSMWSEQELHDSMQQFWKEFANRPQWKMWIFKAGMFEDLKTAGLMFDAYIDEPGGVDRQGSAIFTKNGFYHTPNGPYAKANPPPEASIRRELFFNLIHETGHAFNLYHSFIKARDAWNAPPWMPVIMDRKALSWMNYPEKATAAQGGFPKDSAKWFYENFDFRFDDGELLFMRHAPESYVQMGNAAWDTSHGRVARSSLDTRLELVVRNLKPYLELGEPVLLELRLKNLGGEPVLVHENLDPSDGLVEIAITNPEGVRRPFIPIDHARSTVETRLLSNEDRGVYQSLDLTMGAFGFPFKQPGPYRIEASYTNLDGTTAAAVKQLYVRPPDNWQAVPSINTLFDAKVGSVLYVDGTRVLEEVNEKLEKVRDRLYEQLGPRNPVSVHLNTVLYRPLAFDSKVARPGSATLDVMPREPDRVAFELGPMLMDDAEAVVNTMGHIWYQQVVDTYTQCAVESNKREDGRKAQEQMLRVFKGRNVIPSVVSGIEDKLSAL